MKFILGQKIGMSQYFTKEGQFIPVTLIEAGPCFVLQRKSKEGDNYEAVQIGLEKLKESKVKKSQKQKPYRYIREFRGDIDISKYNVGDKIDTSVFEEGDVIKVSGVSKGKGFQGAVKRWHFKGKSASHGVKHEHRVVGSISSRFPQRVVPGKRMPGRMGGERTTVKNLKIVKVDVENNLLIVKGAIPGRKGTLVEIRG